MSQTKWKRTPWLAGSIAATATLVVATLLTGTAPTTAGAATRPLPERLSHIGNARQVIVVTTSGWNTSYARLQTWRLSDNGTWKRRIDPIPARVGWNGVRRAKNRLQNTGTTPAGTFALPRGFGLANPKGVALPYRKVDRNDWWPYDPTDPKTYNVLQPHRVQHSKWRTEWAERLKSYRKQYRYAVILDYNLPSDIRWRNGQRIAKNTADTSAGGGIFLHVNGSGATAGCVSISRARMLRVLRWLDPDRDPVIVIGPRDVIEKM
ncbi:MAG TPA: L,D-transpeptidase family protein [Actinomycetes bacterium]|nr:L,D-transpeptidase family protein [Actinomycetes bacterium]